MQELVFKVVCCAAAGVGCAVVSEGWTKRLLEQRDREFVPTSTQIWLLRAVMALCGAAVGLLTDGPIAAIYGLLLMCICETAAVIDWNFRIIPNQTVLAVFILKLVFSVPALLGIAGFPKVSPVQSILGMLGCFIVFFAPGLIGKQVGAGDVKLAAAAGFLLGLPDALLAIMVMGVLMIGWCMVQRRVPLLTVLRTNVPMGPFITAGVMVAFLQAGHLL